MDEIITSWEYFIDHNVSSRTGNFKLYKNPILTDHNGFKNNKYSRFPQPPDSVETYIADTVPIAIGVTAFFAGGLGQTVNLYESIRKNDYFEAEYFYKVYLKNVSKWVFLENNRKPFPKSDEEVNLTFLKQHIEDEKNHLTASEDYYLESYNATDIDIKTQIKEYAKAYISWITKKYNSLPPITALSEQLENHSENTVTNLRLNMQPVPASDLSHIEYH